MRTSVLVVVAFAMFGLGAVAHAAAGWQVFATGTDSTGHLYAFARADAVGAKAIAIRPSMPAKVSWFLTCQGARDAVANAIVEVNVARAQKCSLKASADTDAAGTLRLQLLKR